MLVREKRVVSKRAALFCLKMTVKDALDERLLMGCYRCRKS
jgi:hypothetical protein